MGFGVIIALTSVVSVLNLCCWGFHVWGESSRIQDQIAGALKVALEECLSLEVSTTSTTTFSAILVQHWNSFQFIWVSGIVVATAFINLFCCWSCRIGWWGFGGSRRALGDSPSGEGSPVSPLPLEVLARNQLAELRVRRHGAGR